MRARELSRVDGANRLEQFASERESTFAPCGADIVELVIEAMVAEARGRHGREREHFIEPAA